MPKKGKKKEWIVKWSKWKDEEVGICCTSICERSYIVTNRYRYFFFLSDIRSYFTDAKIGWKTLSLRITSRERLKGHIETKSEEKRGGEKKKKKKGKEDERHL